MRPSRGFTLVELMVALTLALAVGGVVHGQLLQGRRTARAQAERVAMQDNVRVAALVLSGELGALGDLLAIAPGAVTYLADRGGGLVCGVAAGSPAEIRVAASTWRGPRAPRPTDSLVVFVEGDGSTGNDDAWVHLGIASVASTTCPGGEAATVFRVVPPAPIGPAIISAITTGSPVRLAEVMQLRYYESGGKSWLGMRSVSTGEAITPLAGPLADSTAAVRGLTLEYLDAAEREVSDPAAVRSVEISLLGVTDQPVHGRNLSRPLVDSLRLRLRVTLRNGAHP
jgi:prepilin-type N-terminal cleavage/methylation domain-containing protein